jgi:inhibitor of the pro-sigma K processing machinery
VDYLNVALAAGFALFILFLIGRLFFKPLKILARIAFNLLVGALVLWGLNLLVSPLGLKLPINAITALTAGFLGLPGTILLVTLHVLLA